MIIPAPEPARLPCRAGLFSFCLKPFVRTIPAWLLLVVGPLQAQEKTRIDILYSETLQFDRRMGENFKRLVGNVRLRHEEAIMFCDSAHLYDRDNEVRAFGNIHVNQGDTLQLYGDKLTYRGDSRVAQVRDNVVLRDRESVLKTDHLDFNLETSIGYYFNGGRLENEENVLTSKQGYYYANDEIFYYRDSVVMVNPDYTIHCDTLKYDTRYATAYFLSPTIIRGDDLYIYCENGWYNLELELSQFNQNAFISTSEQTIRGDSLFYDRGNGFGKAIGNIEINDTTENIILSGHYAEYFEEPESSLVTDSALFIQFSETDTLYLHADTLTSETDSLENRLLRAFYNIRMYRTDFQAVCDSLAYSFSDSVIRMYHQPIIWSDENQLTGDSIQIKTRNRKLDRMELFRSSFIISQEDSIRFNQIKGKDMTGFFREGQLYLIRVTGNGESIYYARDETGMIGVNKAVCSNIEIWVEEGKVRKIRFLNSPEGTFTPPFRVRPEEMILKGFRWAGKLRPVDRNDLFRRNR